MNKKLLRCFVVFSVLVLQSCAGGMNRLNMYQALKANDLDTFKVIVNKIQDASDSEEGLYDALIVASGMNLQATQYLVQFGVPIDYPENQPNSTKRGRALTGAVETNKPDIVRLLLENNADPNNKLWAIDPRDNILYISFVHRDLVIARILLEKGANPNLWSNPVYPSLIAIYGNYPDIKELLEEYGGVKNPTPAERQAHVLTPSNSTTEVKKQQEEADKTIESRLQHIHTLKEKGIISAQEYKHAREKILHEL